MLSAVKRFMSRHLMGRILALMAFLCISFSAHATDVSGTITGTVEWITAGSPYVVVNDLTISGEVTVASGVVVRVRPGKAITVSGVLRLNGNQITSSNDVPGNTPPPAKGDWGPLTLNNTNNPSLASVLNGTIRFGKGLRIIRSSPNLAGLRVENCQGAAIEQDFFSRPLKAQVAGSGNDTNAIILPTGNHAGDIYLGLTGLPYLVNDRLTLGPLPISLQPGEIYVQQAETGSMSVKLLDPAPPAGVQIALQAEPAGIVTIPSSVTIPANETEASFSVLGNVLGSSTITATLEGVGSVSAMARVRTRPTLFLSTGFSLPTRRSHRFFVSMSQATKSALTVNLTSNAPALMTVPASVVIPQGQSQASFTANAFGVGQVTLQANAANINPASDTLTLRESNAYWPNPLRLPLGNNVVNLSLQDVVPAGGASFALTSSDSAVLTVPATVTAPAGASSVIIQAQALTEGTAQVTATSPQYLTATATATVAKIELQLSGNTRIPQDLEERFYLRLLTTAPQAGSIVTLSASNPSVSISPTSFTIPAGDTSTKLFEIKGSSEGPVTITAAGAGLVTETFALTIGPRAKMRWRADQRPELGVQMRDQRIADVTLDGQFYNSQKPRTFTFTSSDSGVATVSTNPNSTTGLASLVGVSEGATQLLATATNIDTSDPFAVQVIKPTLVVEGLDDLRAVQSGRDQFTVRLSLPGGVVPSPNVPQLIDLSIFDPSPSGIIPGFYGSSSGGNPLSSVTVPVNYTFPITIYVGTPTALGSYVVGASLQGNTVRSAVQRVVPLRLRFNLDTFAVGKGLVAQSLRIERRSGIELYAPNQSITVALNNADSLRFSTPAQVEISAGQASVVVPLVGLQTTTAPINLSAFTASGYEASPAIAVSVIEPNIVYEGLDSPSVNGLRNDFRLRFAVPGASEPNQLSATAQTVALSIINAAPANVVAGIYDSYSAGSLVSTVEFGANQNQSAVRYVGAASAVGSYQVRASLAGFANSPWLSAAQNIGPQTNVLSLSYRDFFSSNEVSNAVGQGLYRIAELRLANEPPAPIQVQLVSDPPGALEFSPAIVTLTGAQATVKVTGKTLGTHSFSAVGPSGYGAPSMSLKVDPFGGAVYSISANTEHGFRLNGYAPTGTAVTAQVIDNAPVNTVSLANCPNELSAEGYSLSNCNTQATTGVLSNFSMRFDVGTLGSLTSKRLTTDLIFPVESVQLMENTLKTFYQVERCEGASFSLNPPNLGSVSSEESSKYCTVHVRATQIGTGSLVASNSLGTVTTPAEVTPLVLYARQNSLPHIQTATGDSVVNAVNMVLTFEGSLGASFSGKPSLNISIPSGDYRTDQIFSDPGDQPESCVFVINAGSYGIFRSPCEGSNNRNSRENPAPSAASPAGEQP
jgi:hypothetical protein